MKYLKNATIVTMDEKRRVIPKGYVLFDENSIHAVGPMEEQGNETKQDVEVIDVSGKILLPGLINLHNHPCASLLRATSRGFLLEEWVEKIALPMIFNLDNELLAFGSKYQAAEQLLSGTTTSLLHSVNINDESSFEQLFRPAAELGLRQVVAKELRHAPKKAFNQHAPIPNYARSLSEEIKLAEKIINRWNNSYNGLVKCALAIEAGAAWLLGNATSEEIIREGVALAKRLNIPITCHIAATPHIAYKSFKEITAKGEIEYLDSLGVLSNNWIFVHSLNLTDEEIARISEVGARIVHCPISNAYSADGVARLPKFLEHNVKT
jgi:5-methylthioadenosine/S-adenosylhomocysteine deaminase